MTTSLNEVCFSFEKARNFFAKTRHCFDASRLARSKVDVVKHSFLKFLKRKMENLESPSEQCPVTFEKVKVKVPEGINVLKSQSSPESDPSPAQESCQDPVLRRHTSDAKAESKALFILNKSVTFSDQENSLKVPVKRTRSTPVAPSTSKIDGLPLAPVVKLPPPPRPPRPKELVALEQIEKLSVHNQTIRNSSENALTPNEENKSSDNDYTRPCYICKQQVQEFKERFKSTRSHKQKLEILTSVPAALVPDECLKREFPCTDMIARGAIALRASKGAFSSPPPQFAQYIPDFVKSSIVAFFKDPKNGGEMRGRENTVGTGKEQRQKRAMFVSLSQLYQEYIIFHAAQYSSITVSRFVYLSPTDLIWSRRFWGNGHDICLIHENFQLLMSACTTHYSAGILQVMSKVICPEKESLCMLGYCDKCPIEKNLNSLVGDYNWDEFVEFYFWQGTNDNIGMTLMSEPVPQFTNRLDSTIRKFLKHFFLSTLQNDYLQQIYNCMNRERSLVLVKMDFCEPYTVVSKIGSRKASKYFNYDPQNTITVYPFVIKYYDPHRDAIQIRNIIVISNDLRDNATSAYLFQSEMMKWLKHALPNMKTVIYFADDNPKHHKNSEVLMNLLYHEEDYNLKASLEFTVEGHDLEDVGMLATEVKRQCRLASLNGSAVINCAEDMFKYCKKEMTRYDLQFCYVNRFISRIRSVELRLQRRYRLNNGIIPGIDHFYSFQPDYTKDVFKNDTIRVRRYSLSPTYNVVKVAMSSRGISNHDDFISHYVGSHTHPYDESKLVPGNIVTVNLEGRIFTGKVTRDESVRFGNLGVTLVGRIEQRREGKSGHVALVEEMQVWVSTLDVLMVEESEVNRGEQMKKKKDQQQDQGKVDDGRRIWSARAISPRRFFSIVRRKDK